MWGRKPILILKLIMQCICTVITVIFCARPNIIFVNKSFVILFTDGILSSLILDVIPIKSTPQGQIDNKLALVHYLHKWLPIDRNIYMYSVDRNICMLWNIHTGRAYGWIDPTLIVDGIMQEARYTMLSLPLWPHYVLSFLLASLQFKRALAMNPYSLPTLESQSWRF